MNNLKLMIEIIANKKLSIGGLRSNIISDVEFVKIKDKPFIPASTLKGVLRSCMIRVANLLYNEQVNHTVNPQSYKEDIVSNILGKPHDVSSKVRISNAISEDYKTIILKHVKINEYGIVEEGALFSREYVTKNSKFKFTITANGLKIEEYRLLFLALAEFRYQRIGRCGLTDIKIIMNESNIPEDIANDKIVKRILEVLCK